MVSALPVRGGQTLTTVADARAFVLALPPERVENPRWERAAELMLKGAGTDAIWQALRLALFHDGLARPASDGGAVSAEYLGGRRLGPEELDTIRRELEAMDRIAAISAALRDIVLRRWPHLAPKLPPPE